MLSGCFSPLIPCPDSLAAPRLARRQGLERGCVLRTHGLAPAYHSDCLPPPPASSPPFPALQYT